MFDKQGLHTGGTGTWASHPDVYLLTAGTAAERWSSRPECSWPARCQEPVLGQEAGLGPGLGLVLRKRSAQRRGLGLDLGLDKAGSPEVYRCGGKDPKDGAKNHGRGNKEEGSKERSEAEGGK